jgi:hypothetical protein
MLNFKFYASIPKSMTLKKSETLLVKAFWIRDTGLEALAEILEQLPGKRKVLNSNASTANKQASKQKLG